MIPTWFLYLSGFSMFVLGILQLQQRPRVPGQNFVERYLNVGTFWSLGCLVIGAGLLAMALGYWDGPLAAFGHNGSLSSPPAHHPRYH